MNWKKLTCGILAVFLFASLLAGCSRQLGPKKNFAQCVAARPTGLILRRSTPRKAIGVPEAFVLHQLFEGLAALDSKGAYIPGVAERWETSADGLKWTFFYLRSNAKWSNGDPVTAHDFEYSWKSVLSPQLASRYAAQLYVVKNAESYNKGKVGAEQVSASKQSTLQRWKSIWSILSLISYLWLRSIHIIRLIKKFVEANEKWHTDPKTIVGNGAFKMVSWTHNSKIELVPNESYWNKAVV